MLKKKTLRKLKTVRKEKKNSKSLSFPNLGDVLRGRFELVEKLGEGSFSVNYKAYDNEKNCFKSLKVFGKYTDVFNSLNHIRAEAKLFSSLQHPNLPEFHELHESDFIFLELEYINAQDLYTKMAKSISKKDAVNYAKQLAECMFYLHFKDIEHRDLKPENILINNDKKLFLIDFGTAALQKVEDTNIESEATYEYCPPETQKNEEKAFQRDIFAFGVILYQLYYGKYPFETDDDAKIEYKMPAHLIGSKKNVDKVIKNCLQYFQEDRYKNFQEILDDLKESPEQNGLVFKTITQYIVKKIPFKNISADFKKDLKYLWLSLLCLLILLPFFWSVKRYDSHIEREIEIDAPPYSIFVNAQAVGSPPLRVKLKKGDELSFVGKNGISDFDMSYKNEKSIRVDVKNNKVYLNKKLKGLHYTREEKIPKQIEFLSLRRDISPKKLQRIRNKNLRIGIAPTVTNSLLHHLPKQTKSLSLRNYKNNVNLQALSRLKRLNNLDLSNTEKVNADSLPKLESLKVLNLQNTKTSNLRPLNRLKRLRNLNISSNNIRSVDTLIYNDALESINLNNNEELTDLIPLTNLPNIRQISNNNVLPANQSDLIRDLFEKQNFENLKKQQIIYHRKNKFQLVINFLLTLLIAAIIVQIFRMIFKKGVKNLSELNQDIPKEPEPAKKVKELSQTGMKMLDSAITDKRFYTPEKDNALYYLRELLADHPGDSVLTKKKDETLRLLNEKIKLHLTRKEFEPVYLATNAINNFFPNKKNNKILAKAKKNIEKKSAIKWISVKGGSYMMGDFEQKTALPHQVKLSNFKISETTVTNQQFCDFLNDQGNKVEGGQTWVKVDTQYSRISLENGTYKVKEPYESFPVYEVSWYGAQRFCEWLGGRLPTEAEWEYTARSRGEENLYASGNKIDKKKANYLIDANDTLWHSVFPVKSFPANDLDVYEMSGNILEWCFDWFDKNYYSESEINNPKGPKNGELKVVRGGAWCFNQDQAKTFYRGAAKPSSRNNYTGFRVVIPE